MQVAGVRARLKGGSPRAENEEARSDAFAAQLRRADDSCRDCLRSVGPHRRRLRTCGVTLLARRALMAAGFLLVPFAGSAAAESVAFSDSTIHRVHNALFDTWLPADSLLLPDSQRASCIQLRDGLWTAFSKSPVIRSALAELEGPAPSPCAPVGGRFSDLTLAGRETLLLRLLRCTDNDVRRPVMQLRVIYLKAIYSSAWGRAIAGLAQPSSSPASNHVDPPHFPPTWLTSDSTRHEIRARAGCIDDIIVGSGPAGSVLAYELRRSGRRVLVLDQGSFVLPGSMATRANPKLLESGGNRSSVSGSVLFNNAESVGGGTAVNIDLVFSPTHPSVQSQLGRWRAEGRLGPGQFSLPALESADRWVKGMLGTRTPADSEVNRNNRVLWDGAQRSGLHPRLYELNTYAPGQWPTTLTDKRSSVSALLLPAMLETNDPLELIPDAEVTRVIVEPGSGGDVASGVQFVERAPWNADGVLRDPLQLRLRPGDTLIVRAKRVILCAGTLGSSAILMRSRIANPAIGRGIVGHIAVPVIGVFDKLIDATTGTPATVFVDDYAISRGFMLEAMSAGPEYAAVMVPGTGRHVFDVVSHYRYLAGFGVMLIDSPSPDNRITLGSSGKPEIHYEISPGDRRRLRAAIADGVRIMFRAGARRVIVPSHEDIYRGSATPFEFTSADQVDELSRKLEFLPNATLVTSAHMQGSNKMGSRSMDAVVGDDFHVWGVTGLYVMDSSVFPSSIGANPMQSIYVMAKLFADDLRRESGPQSEDR